jgi:radical SAM superfamily enzyme YgiQ (UPF0313 family)
MKMKALLINPYPYYAKGINTASIYPPIGLTYISSVLESNNFESKVIDANMLKASNEKLIKIISSQTPEFVGISANIVTAKSAMELAALIKRNFKSVTVVCGGPMPTLFPEKFLSVCDIVVRGEGEETFLEIVKNKKIREIKGISFKRNNKIIHTSPRNLIENLNKLPYPAWHLLIPSLKKYKSQVRKKPMAPIFTSRGCPYRCVYCNKNIFGTLFRARTPENVVKEIDWLVEKFRVREIHIMDDNFTFDMERAERIMDLIIKGGYNLLISCQAGVRCDKLTRRLVKKMKLAGVYRVGVGIESGNQQILIKNGKELELKAVRKACSLLKNFGIQVKGCFMFGLWGDTPKTMYETIKFAININPLIAAFAITTPFPGTPLYSMIKKYGKFLERIENGISYGFFGDRVFYETNITRKDDVLRCYKLAYRKFYLRVDKIVELLANIKSSEELKWFLNIILQNPLW